MARRNHHGYSDLRHKLETRRETSLSKIDEGRSRRGGPHWWIGGIVRKKNGDLVPVCIGVFNSETEAYQAAYEKKFEGEPDIFSCQYSTTTEANRVYRMRRAERGEKLNEVLERTRHRGRDIGVA